MKISSKDFRVTNASKWLRPWRHRSAAKRVAFNSGPFQFAQTWLQLMISTMRCVLGIDQDRLVVDNRIAIIRHAIFGRNLVVGHSFAGKLGAHRDRLVIRVRGTMLLRDVSAEARLLIDAKKTVLPRRRPRRRRWAPTGWKTTQRAAKSRQACFMSGGWFGVGIIPT